MDLDVYCCSYRIFSVGNASFLILTGKNAVLCIVSLCVVMFRTVTLCNVNFSFVLIFVALINLGYVNACTVSL